MHTTSLPPTVHCSHVLHCTTPILDIRMWYTATAEILSQTGRYSRTPDYPMPNHDSQPNENNSSTEYFIVVIVSQYSRERVSLGRCVCVRGGFDVHVVVSAMCHRTQTKRPIWRQVKWYAGLCPHYAPVRYRIGQLSAFMSRVTVHFRNLIRCDGWRKINFHFII